MINLQKASGAWLMSDCHVTLQEFVGDDFQVTQSGDLADEIAKIATNLTGLSAEDAIATLIAIYVLQEVFDQEESEWVLLVKKAKSCLTNSGLPKPNQLLKLINFTTK